jgi:hypothetical protein
MVGPGMLRRQQEEDQVDRLVVERFEIDRFVQPRKYADDVGQRRQPPVGYGNAAADARGPQVLALQQRVEDFPRVDPGQRGSLLGELLQHLLLGLRLQGRIHRLRRNEISKVHVCLSLPDT